MTYDTPSLFSNDIIYDTHSLFTEYQLATKRTNHYLVETEAPDAIQQISVTLDSWNIVEIV